MYAKTATEHVTNYTQVAHAQASILAEKASKLSEAVTQKTIIGELDKENKEFSEQLKREKLVDINTVNAPWIGLPNEEQTKKHILALSNDPRNFLEEPPAGIEINVDNVEQVAASLMKHDPNLNKIRYELVPKKISEEKFWNNYFYRVSLVQKMSKSKASKQDLEETNDKEEKPQTSKADVKEDKEEMVTENNKPNSPSLKEELESVNDKEKTVSKDSSPIGKLSFQFD